VDETSAGLTVVLTEDDIFYYPNGSSPPVIDYTTLDLGALVAYGYNPYVGGALLVEMENDTTTIWIGNDEDGGLYSGVFPGDIALGYDQDSVEGYTSHEDYLIYQIKKNGDTYYIATDQGLHSANDPHGEWTRLTGDLSNNTGNDAAPVHTAAVAFGAGDLMYTGGYFGGFLLSEDGVSFTHSNMGMMHLNGTPEQLAMFKDEFENVTPADPTTGIYDTALDWWGDLPEATSEGDIDGDPKITILFLNIDDQYYLGTGDGTYISGYFDGRNELPLAYMALSNQAEMFYLDSDPQWINRAGSAACNQMFNLINWNQDFQEDRWLREGLSTFSQHVAGYPVADSPITFSQINNLIAWGDKNPDVEHVYTFLMVLYLYEQLLPDYDEGGPTIHGITELATSEYRGTSGLGRLITEKNGGVTSDSVDYTPVFASFFNDFVLACAIDISDTLFYDGKYGFEGVDTQFVPPSYTWYLTPTTTPPFKWHLPFWSARAMQVNDQVFFQAGPNKENQIDEAVVNGDDRNCLNFYLLYAMADAFEPEMQPDEIVLFQIPSDSIKQKGSLVIPNEYIMDGEATYPNLMRMISICSSTSEDGPSCFTFGDDSSTPEDLFLTITQNPIDDQFIDVYSFANRRLFPDGGQLYRVESLGLTDLEGPIVEITGGISDDTGEEVTFNLDQEVFYTNPQASTYSYHIAYHLEDIELPADLEFLAYGEDIVGNEKESDPTLVSVDFIEGSTGGTVQHPISNASVHVPPMALKDDIYLLLSVSDLPSFVTAAAASREISAPTDPSHYQVGPLVSAGSAGTELTAPIQLVIPFNADLAGDSEIGVYRAEGDSWVYVGGEVNENSGMLTTYSWKFGQFQAFAGPLTDMKPEMPYSFKLDQNYPNPFNPITKIQFEIPLSQHVKLNVYNVAGQLVERLADKSFEAGRHSLQWNAVGLSSGVYFLRMEAEEGTLYRKMILLK